MNRRKLLKIGLGSGLVAVVAAAGLTVASPTLAQGVAAPVAALTQRGGGPMGGRGMQMSTIATALSMTEADLRTELEAGKSVSDVATAKNVSLDKVISAIVDAETKNLQQAVTDGKLTQAQADTMLSNLKLTLPSQLQTKVVAGMKGGFEGGRGGMKGGMQLTTIATALGMTETDLRTELQAGKSVADVATTKSISLDKVISAIVDAETKNLQQAVTDGKLTQAQADQRIADLKANLPAQLAQKGLPAGGPGRGHGGPGGRGPGGPNGQNGQNGGFPNGPLPGGQQQNPGATPAPGA
jgi:hypothetical protein